MVHLNTLRASTSLSSSPLESGQRPATMKGTTVTEHKPGGDPVGQSNQATETAGINSRTLRFGAAAPGFGGAVLAGSPLGIFFNCAAKASSPEAQQLAASTATIVVRLLETADRLPVEMDVGEFDLRSQYKECLKLHKDAAPELRSMLGDAWSVNVHGQWDDPGPESQRCASGNVWLEIRPARDHERASVPDGVPAPREVITREAASREARLQELTSQVIGKLQAAQSQAPTDTLRIELPVGDSRKAAQDAERLLKSALPSIGSAIGDYHLSVSIKHFRSDSEFIYPYFLDVVAKPR